MSKLFPGFPGPRFDTFLDFKIFDEVLKVSVSTLWQFLLIHNMFFHIPKQYFDQELKSKKIETSPSGEKKASGFLDTISTIIFNKIQVTTNGLRG